MTVARRAASGASIGRGSIMSRGSASIAAMFFWTAQPKFGAGALSAGIAPVGRPVVGAVFHVRGIGHVAELDARIAVALLARADQDVIARHAHRRESFTEIADGGLASRAVL